MQRACRSTRVVPDKSIFDSRTKVIANAIAYYDLHLWHPRSIPAYLKGRNPKDSVAIATAEILQKQSFRTAAIQEYVCRATKQVALDILFQFERRHLLVWVRARVGFGFPPRQLLFRELLLWFGFASTHCKLQAALLQKDQMVRIMRKSKDGKTAQKKKNSYHVGGTWTMDIRKLSSAFADA